MEVLIMKMQNYILINIEELDMDTIDCEAFEVNFQRAILLALLKSRKLTQIQFEACMDKVIKKSTIHS